MKPPTMIPPMVPGQETFPVDDYNAIAATTNREHYRIFGDNTETGPGGHLHIPSVADIDFLGIKIAATAQYPEQSAGIDGHRYWMARAETKVYPSGRVYWQPDTTIVEEVFNTREYLTRGHLLPVGSVAMCRAIYGGDPVRRVYFMEAAPDPGYLLMRITSVTQISGHRRWLYSLEEVIYNATTRLYSAKPSGRTLTNVVNGIEAPNLYLRGAMGNGVNTNAPGYPTTLDIVPLGIGAVVQACPYFRETGTDAGELAWMFFLPNLEDGTCP